MAKKLLAVVLTGVMAVSMLTGCALGDAAKAKALENALNSDQVKNAAVAAQTDEAKKTQEKNTKYDYKSELNSVAGSAWKDEAAMKSGKADTFDTTYVGKLAAYTKNNTKYFVYVVDVTDVKTSKKGEWTTRAIDLREAVTGKGFDSTNVDKIKDYNSNATNNTAKFGVEFKSVTTEDSNHKKTTTDYAIIVFEAGVAAA
ncbi:MAG: hypothetical protein PUH19_00700 [Faecalibacterium prausnitzii]|nr:hypothetical protein [Faecalibacterium prausnitzii]